MDEKAGFKRLSQTPANDGSGVPELTLEAFSKMAQELQSSNDAHADMVRKWAGRPIDEIAVDCPEDLLFDVVSLYISQDPSVFGALQDSMQEVMRLWELVSYDEPFRLFEEDVFGRYSSLLHSLALLGCDTERDSLVLLGEVAFTGKEPGKVARRTRIKAYDKMTLASRIAFDKQFSSLLRSGNVARKIVAYIAEGQ